jgi:hypothetical protein
LNEKQVIRYIGFASTDNGGRALDFFVGSTGSHERQIFVDIPGPHFVGADKILYQEAAGIAYLKIKELCGLGTIGNALHVSLTASDIGRFRQALPASGRRKRFSRTHDDQSATKPE